MKHIESVKNLLWNVTEVRPGLFKELKTFSLTQAPLLRAIKDRHHQAFAC